MLQGGTFIFSVLLETHNLQWLGIIKKEYQYSWMKSDILTTILMADQPNVYLSHNHC